MAPERGQRSSMAGAAEFWDGFLSRCESAKRLKNRTFIASRILRSRECHWNGNAGFCVLNSIRSRAQAEVVAEALKDHKILNRGTGHGGPGKGSSE